MDRKSVVLFYPGRNKPLKSYQAYFNDIILTTNVDESTSDVVLCHSRGIVDALKHSNKHIIAMDPSSCDLDNVPKNTFITVFLQEHRKSEFKTGERKTFIYYQEDTHYPYMVKTLRNKIMSLL